MRWPAAFSWHESSCHLILGAALGFVACGDAAIIGEEVPNTPPQTHIEGAPPVLGQASFAVPLFWSGEDPDGEVVAYQWRISNNGPDGVVDVADTLEINLPWHWTTDTDSLFVVSADLDSFGIDVDDPRQDARDYRFWQTHTFFVRAVDDEGRVDPTPAHLSFTATTIAPTVEIDTPKYISSNTCTTGPRVLSFGWTGADSDDTEGDPVAVRYLLLPWGTPEENCLIQQQYQQLSPIRGDDPQWSPWIEYDAPADSGRFVTLPRQDENFSYLFAVQVRDKAGAVTPTFEWGRNVRHVRTTANKFPLLNFGERFLGTDSFVATNKFIAYEVVEGQLFEVSFDCDAAYYGGLVSAYRWGVDVTDPQDDDDPGWGVGWGLGNAWQRPLVPAFLQGSHNVVMQCRDNSGTVSQGSVILNVIQIADPSEQRPLLLVDDWRLEDTPATRALEEQWDREWEALLKPHVPGFQKNDIIDTQDEPLRMKFRKVNEYRSVIWFTNNNQSSYLHTNFAPVSETRSQFNWLEIYQSRVGNLMLVGPGATFSSLEDRAPPLIFPIAFNLSDRGAFGFGTEDRPDGTIINRGTTRWPYSAWCLSTIDMVRPPLQLIWGETPTRLQRSLDCDGLAVAEVADDLTLRFPDAQGVLTDLLPDPERLDTNPLYKGAFEEVYNVNPSSRRLSLTLRECQTPMFQMRTRRAEGLQAGSASNCLPLNAPQSTLEGAPVAILSSRYSDTKQLSGTEDVLWGFHPLSMSSASVEAALVWILRNRWDLRIR